MGERSFCPGFPRLLSHFMKAICASLSYVLILVGALIAQQPKACLQREIAVNVLDDEGRQVSGLASERLRAVVGGQNVAVSSFRLEDGPGRIILLVSEGMWADLHYREFLEFLVHRVFEIGSPRNDFAVFTFGYTTKLRIEFGKHSVALEQAFAQLNPSSKKHEPLPKQRPLRDRPLERGILQVADYFGSAMPGDSIYLITGGEFSYLYNEGVAVEITDSLRDKGIRLFVALLDPHNAGLNISSGVWGSEPPLIPDDLSPMQNSVANTGGRVMILPPQIFHIRLDPPSLGALDNFYGSMFQHYVIDLRLPDEVRRPQKLDIFLVDANGKRDKKLTVLHPQKLFPCPQPYAQVPIETRH